MQTTDKRNLPKRNRYYQGMIDLNTEVIREFLKYVNGEKSDSAFVKEIEDRAAQIKFCGIPTGRDPV